MPLAPALIDLVPLIMFAVALALCVLSLYVAKAFFGAAGGAVGWIPGVGGWLKGKIEDVAHHITSELGHAATVLEARVGASWHSFARLVDWMGREIARHAALIERIANDLVTGNVFDLVRLEVQGARRLIHYVEKQVVGIGHDVIGRLRTIEKGIGADVLPRIRSLDRRLTRDLANERARARAAEAQAERAIGNLWEWTRAHAWVNATDAFAFAVAIALTRLGLSWLRCPSLGRLGKRFGCAPWTLLEDLLAASLTAFAVADLCTFANVAMDTALLIRPALLELVDVEDALVGCHGASGAPPLEPVRLRLPDNSRNLPLAA